MEHSSSIFIYIYISRTNVYPQNLYFPLRQWHRAKGKQHIFPSKFELRISRKSTRKKK